MDGHVDAIGGSIAAALSVLLFYPVEVFRVLHQTADHRTTLAQSLTTLPTRLFRGICNFGMAARVSHTLLSSFLYYALYRQLAIQLRGLGGLSPDGKRTAVSNAIASNGAAILAVLISMPLDGFVLRAQAGTGTETGTEEGSNHSSSQGGQVHDHDQDTSLLSQLGELYRGLTPALLLCLNPAIHFTTFDRLKLAVLNRQRQPGDPPVGYDQLDSYQLATKEAFVLGLVAKAVATVLTFPLLRAKVLMMTATSVEARRPEGLGVQGEVEVQAQVQAGTAVIQQPTVTMWLRHRWHKSDVRRMLTVLRQVLVIQGVAGLYRGLLVHLAHTTLRGAVSMALKERFVALLGSLLRRRGAEEARRPQPRVGGLAN